MSNGSRSSVLNWQARLRWDSSLSFVAVIAVVLLVVVATSQMSQKEIERSYCNCCKHCCLLEKR